MVKQFLLDTVQSVALALGIFAIVYFIFLQPHEVRGKSMEPNFQDGEYLLTDKFSYKIGKPGRGDVIVFAAPPTREEDFIKRIIGVSGDTITVKEGKIQINDHELKEGYLPDTTLTFGGPILHEGEKVTLKDNQYFVLGDNRSHSQDSRYFGTINRSDIVGRAWLIYWPPKDVGFVRRIIYAGF